MEKLTLRKRKEYEAILWDGSDETLNYLNDVFLLSDEFITTGYTGDFEKLDNNSLQFTLNHPENCAISTNLIFEINNYLLIDTDSSFFISTFIKDEIMNDFDIVNTFS